MTDPIVKNRFSPSQKVVSPPSKHRAQQQFKDDCDINTIMRKFQKTKAMDHVTIHGADYGFASPLTLQESLNTVIKAQEMFDDLPSSLRKRFDHSPSVFLEFVQDENNKAEMAELGLLNKAASLAAQAPPEPQPTVKEPEPVPTE